MRALLRVGCSGSDCRLVDDEDLSSRPARTGDRRCVADDCDVATMSGKALFPSTELLTTVSCRCTLAPARPCASNCLWRRDGVRRGLSCACNGCGRCGQRFVLRPNVATRITHSEPDAITMASGPVVAASPRTGAMRPRERLWDIGLGWAGSVQ